MIAGMPRSTTSTATTRGVRVTVRSHYLEDQSMPVAGRYVFAYRVTITNEGQETVRLVSRHWIIEDGDGQVEEVRGPGVVGEQPMLDPGDSFEYSSGAVLRTQRGVMRGTYQMRRGDGSEFDVEIAPFSLERPYSLN